MQKISIRTGNTKDSVKRAIAAINRWGKKEILQLVLIMMQVK